MNGYAAEYKRKWFTKGSSISVQFPHIESITTPDKWTVVIKCNDPTFTSTVVGVTLSSYGPVSFQ